MFSFKKVFLKSIKQSISLLVFIGGGVVIISLVLFVNHFVLSWTEPTANPPGGFTPSKPYSLSAHDGDPADVVYVDDDGNVGVGTTNPGAKVDISGEIITDGVNVKNAFIQKELDWHTEPPDYDPYTCYDSVEDLPEEIRNRSHPRCYCDTSDSEIDCDIKDLTDADQPGCYDKYQLSLPSYALNWSNANCYDDLISDEIQYFQLWKIKQKDNIIESPFLNYNSCMTVVLKDNTQDVGAVIKEKLERTSCLKLELKPDTSYKWNVPITIPAHAFISIRRYGQRDAAINYHSPLIIMDEKHAMTYNGTTYRVSKRAFVNSFAIFRINGINIDENINDSRPLTPASGSAALFIVNSQGIFSFSYGEISATEDIVNFRGWSANGIFQTGHSYFYRKPSSPRSDLYVVRAYDGWNFKGNHGFVSWPTGAVHLNKKIDGTTGEGVYIYPSAEASRITVYN